MSSTPVDRLVAILERTQPTRVHKSKGKRTKMRAKPLTKPQKTQRELTIETLIEAKNLVGEGWVQHEIAVDENGNACSADSPHAVAWCMSGALQAGSYKVGYPGTSASTQRIERAARAILDANNLHPVGNEHVISTVARVNDGEIETMEDVVKAIDNAITYLQNQ